ncbi:S8 family serine peptidase [Crossiella sp. CA198]|uniref:S8 family serine peptidase n=1 Tax=Crossiella sp. CA198 TaxID=3455607 RepID=UPI003F8D2E37
MTLVTGDQVLLEPNGEPREVRRGPGREQMSFSVQRRHGRHHVIPADARALLAEGKLDQRLFDVTALAGFGYTDDKRADLPLILGYQGSGPRARARTFPGVAGVTVHSELSSVTGLSVGVAKRDASTLWAALTGGTGLGAGVAKVWLNGKRTPLLDKSTAQIGAPAAWQGGHTGKGVTVAVLDTGIDTGHPDLAGRVAAAKNFTAEEAKDFVGHGTHVASILAGRGEKYRGVAPEATLLDGKICDRDGCAEDGILRGMEWAAAEKAAKVVNFSVGGDDAPGLDPVEQAVNTLTERHGTLFVAAAGNADGRCTVNSPASADAALAVGAVDRADQVADFSCIGPRAGDGAIKPDLTAPGVDIVAARSQHSEGKPEERHVAMSGTSMATPHVAGAAAILAGQHPDWRADRIKSVLMASARPHPERTVFEQGAGRVDVAAAVTTSVTSAPTALNLGTQRFPHHDDEPVVRAVTYHNAGSTPVTLTPGFEVRGPGGVQPPTGMFTVSPATVTVPAGGSAPVTITADTRKGGPDGQYTGRLVAKAGALTVQTPFVIEQEVPSYDLTIVHRDRAGANTAKHSTHVVFLSHNDYRSPTSADGVVKVRLPQGRYLVETMIESPARTPAARDIALLTQPTVDLTGDTTVVLDAAISKPVRVTVPPDNAKLLHAEIATARATQQWPWWNAWVGPTFDGVHTGHVGPPAAATEFSMNVHGQWAEPETPGRGERAPYFYSLSWQENGRMPTGFTRKVDHAGLARFEANYRATGDGQAARALLWEVLPNGRHTLGLKLTLPLPHKRIEYRNAEFETLDYVDVVRAADPTGYPLHSLQTGITRHRAQNYVTTWNGAPFSPSYRWYAGATRQGDNLTISIDPHSDQDGHNGYYAGPHQRATLFRDGKEIGEGHSIGNFRMRVPPSAGNYRLQSEHIGTGMTGFSTKVLSTWTFRSEHVPGTEPAKLPLHLIKFAPRLDEHNRAPADRDFLIPVRVEQQLGAPARTIRQLTTEVSYDDGVTWTTAEKIVGHDGNAIVRVRHPHGNGFVSLRAKAVDQAGESIEHTIVRAYRLG